MGKEWKVVINVKFPLSLAQEIGKFAKEKEMSRNRAIIFLVKKGLESVGKVSNYGGVETSLPTHTPTHTTQNTHTPFPQTIVETKGSLKEEKKEQTPEDVMRMLLQKTAKEYSNEELLEEYKRAKKFGWFDIAHYLRAEIMLRGLKLPEEVS